MLFSVFKEELPNIAKARIRPFLAGVVTFFVLHFVLVSGTEKVEPPINGTESSLRPARERPAPLLR